MVSAVRRTGFVCEGSFEKLGLFLGRKFSGRVKFLLAHVWRAMSAPTQRDRHLQCIAEHGRMGWQKRSGYNTRARAEAAISRYKRVIGDGLRSRKDERRATEVDVGVYALNRMLELGRPISVRIA